MREKLPNTPDSVQTNQQLNPADVKYCQQGSDWFNSQVDEDMGDWRVTRGRIALETGRDPDSRSPIRAGGNIDKNM